MLVDIGAVASSFLLTARTGRLLPAGPIRKATRSAVRRCTTNSSRKFQQVMPSRSKPGGRASGVRDLRAPRFDTGCGGPPIAVARSPGRPSPLAIWHPAMPAIDLGRLERILMACGKVRRPTMQMEKWQDWMMSLRARPGIESLILGTHGQPEGVYFVARRTSCWGPPCPRLYLKPFQSGCILVPPRHVVPHLAQIRFR